MLPVKIMMLSFVGSTVAWVVPPNGVGDVVGGAGEAVVALLEADPQPHCSVILLTDGTTSPYTIFKLVGQMPAPWDVGVFEVAADGQDANVTQEQLSWLVGQARRVRQLSWCVTVVVVSDDPAFLATFAQWSLKGRLLVWPTRLLALTRLPLQQLQHLLTTHWTFSMMNAIFLTLDDNQDNTRCVVYSHLPYSARGAEIVRVASWTPARGLTIYPGRQLFQEKFNNFYGASVSVTGLHWPPYLVVYEDTTSEGTKIKKLKGPDGLLARTVADSLNFTCSFFPAGNWLEAADRVVERKSFMVVVFHLILYTRMERYDYSYPYTFVSFGFGLAKPQLQPQWQSLYYPLADEVWASTLAALLLMPVFMFMMNRNNNWFKNEYLGRDGQRRNSIGSNHKKRSIAAVTQEIFGTFLGQNLSKSLPTGSPSRVLTAGWLVFAFIIGTVYRGNLTAALTLPRYPPRPETLEEVVNHVDRVTVIPIGKDWQKQFRESGSSALQRLADIMYIGPSILEGLQEATVKRQAHLDERHVMNHWMADSFTQADGGSPLYYGRESIIPGASGWPIPHDAPYKPQLDNIMMTVNEAGLYEKWTEDTLDEARRVGRAKQQDKQQQKVEQTGDGAQRGSSSSSSSSSITALTIIHMQGLLLLLLLGLFLSGLIFATEILVVRCCRW